MQAPAACLLTRRVLCPALMTLPRLPDRAYPFQLRLSKQALARAQGSLPGSSGREEPGGGAGGSGELAGSAERRALAMKAAFDCMYSQYHRDE